MNILIVNASPRRKGNVAEMLRIMQEEAESLGHTVTVLRVAEMSVRPCTGCMACRTSLECVLPQDGAQHTLEALRRADGLIVGAPCYWGNMPGSLKLLFDRMVYGMMGETPLGIPKALHKGKRAVIVSTCTTPFPLNMLFNQTRGVVRALKEILGYSGFRIVGTVQKGGTKTGKGLTVRERRRCVKMIGRL